MSVLMAVRIPDELAAKIDAHGPRSSVIIQILQNHFDRSRRDWAKPPIPTFDVIDAVVKNMAGDDSTRVGLGSQPKPAPIIDTMPRQSHDTKTCTLYGCLMCKVDKEKR